MVGRRFLRFGKIKAHLATDVSYSLTAGLTFFNHQGININTSLQLCLVMFRYKNNLAKAADCSNRQTSEW